MRKRLRMIMASTLCLSVMTSCAMTPAVATPDKAIEEYEILTTEYTMPPATLEIDGESKNVNGFNLNGENFYHIRSLAAAMINTPGRFKIETPDGIDIHVKTGYNYTDGAVEDVDILNKELNKDTRRIIVNGSNIGIPSYVVDGNTYIGIKDLSEHLGYKLDYIWETNTIKCDTTSSICSYIRDKVYNPQFTYYPFTKIELSMDDINKIFAHSSIPNYGKYFYNMQETYGVNIIYAIAVCYVESGRGKYPCAKYNYFGMLGRSFNYPDEGINAFGKLMNNKLYYGKSIDQIAPIYCDARWAGLIKSMMTEIWSYI